MLAAMRQAKILEQVKQAGGARVSDLSQMLGVSDMTIRRDLEALAQAGTRIQGPRRRDDHRVREHRRARLRGEVDPRTA